MIEAKDVIEQKAKYYSIVEELHRHFKDNKTFSEETNEGERRPIFVLKSEDELNHVRNVMNELEGIVTEITRVQGVKPRMRGPKLETNISYYNVWLNTVHSSTTVSVTRLEILEKLKRFKKSCDRYKTRANKARSAVLAEEIAFFENETEEKYRKRSLGSTTVITHVYREDKTDKRFNVSDGGLFILGNMFRTPEIKFKTNDTKQKASVFNELECLNYSGGFDSELYRESEVTAMKKKMGIEDKATKAKVTGKSNAA